MKTEPCDGPEPCGHTDEEHFAFDDGVVAGEKGFDMDSCPFKPSSLAEAWLTGHSVGVLNRKSEQKERRDRHG